MRYRWLVLVALLGALAGCRSKDAPAPAASAVASEVPAPAALLAEISVGNPKDTWQRLRLLGGDLAQALPSSLPVLLATSLSLPPSAAGNLDETLPMVGALLSRTAAAEPDVVLGMHVRSGAELVASLTLGDAAKFRRLELGERLVRLLPAPGAPELNGALGVSGNYLLLATRVEALSEAGRFVAEGVSRRARSEPGLTLRAGDKVLAGPASKALRDAWSAKRALLEARERAQREAKGRAPDFADPAVLLGGVDNIVESLLAVLESSRELSFELLPESDRLRAELSLLPAAEGAAALLARELVAGSLAPLLQLPAATHAAISIRGEPSPSREDAQRLGPALAQLFGERLRPEQTERLLGAFQAFGESRRGAGVVGLISAPSPALLVISELSAADTFSSSLADVLGLLELSPISNWLEATAGKPSLLLGKPEGSLRRARVRFQRGVKGASVPLPSELFVVWEAKDGLAHVVISAEPKLTLEALAGLPRLSESEWLARSRERLGEHAAIGVFADARLVAPGAAEPAPLLLVFGKRAERINVSLDLAPPALRALSGLLAMGGAP